MQTHAVHCWPMQSPISQMSRAQARSAMHSFLSTMGYQASDFTVSMKHASWLSGVLGWKDHFLTVRCRSTGHERVYSAGPFSPWLAELLRDVELGAFANCLQ